MQGYQTFFVVGGGGGWDLSELEFPRGGDFKRKVSSLEEVSIDIINLLNYDPAC